MESAYNRTAGFQVNLLEFLLPLLVPIQHFCECAVQQLALLAFLVPLRTGCVRVLLHLFQGAVVCFALKYPDFALDFGFRCFELLPFELLPCTLPTTRPPMHVYDLLVLALCVCQAAVLLS